jgi:hypothetical protein
VSEPLLKIEFLELLTYFWLSFDSPAMLVIMFADMSNTVTGDRMRDNENMSLPSTTS